LVDTFVESAIGVKRDDASGAQRFLQEQKSEVEQKLRDTEDRLAEFKKQNIGMMPGQAGDYYQRRQTAAEELAKLRSQYSIAEQRRDELRRQLQGEEPTFGLFTGGVTTKAAPVTPVDARVAELEREKERLLLEYTDKHPRIRSIDETILQLKQLKDPNASAPRSPEVDSARIQARALDVNPVYQNMKINLSQAELEVVELRNKIAQQQIIVTDLQGKVNTIPEVEAELVRLNRDYDNNRQQYQLLSQRLESARLSEQAEGAREQIKFRIIDPPTEPLVPLGPNRQLLATAVFVVALGIGGALALLLNLLNPVFSDRRSLTAIAQVPVLGVVALTRNTTSFISAGSMRWIGGTATLGLLYFAMLVMASQFATVLGSVAR
jgi:polysaccharide chain length determinant protein (PEP-CTERM system associated)